MITENEINEMEVRALSWKQPYADLMLEGKQETRKWKTNYRGLVLICASKKYYSPEEVLKISGPVQSNRIVRDFFPTFEDIPKFNGLGVAVAVGRLEGCRMMRPDDESKTFVKYKTNLFVWEFTDVVPIELFKWIGTQGWRTLTPEQKLLIKLQT